MSKYRNNDISDLYTNVIHYCPHIAKQYKCPFSTFYRRELVGFKRQQQQGPPKTPPPNFIPQLSDVPEASLMAVDSGAIAPCVYRFSYIWLKNGQSFWAYLVYVGKTSTSGWRYRKGRWEYFGVDLKEIKSFTCY
ncbi:MULTISPECIES: hypothetical protein [Clostridium]|uniref:Uncharacterized protein n=2 Tax=Clostridium TaxID=1485 RepID=D8GMZ4_CLOLD|nr:MULTISPECIES: hypothetical protein [Clostridium]ADK15782.1 conserved hypothetical protein [Clostridium ljungdahlii DSM 13528]AGY75037.1 hypothetical protein CAETHG_0810 [Clostridium autoethanogenum DSM 10061]ALU35211.1 Hypothetical protein CLAU_0782 [Clostridium autoethanogenum DSM 10061]OAA86413.1 hypothetical protein WX45_04077 [Clostridium ljungdahlii DSM 13528]OVY49288.1 hypothetical protein WX72_03638 [Clostridium autoethanogenum]